MFKNIHQAGLLGALAAITIVLLISAPSPKQTDKEVKQISLLWNAPMGSRLLEVVPSYKSAANHYIYEFRGDCFIKYNDIATNIKCPEYPKVKYENHGAKSEDGSNKTKRSEPEN